MSNRRSTRGGGIKGAEILVLAAAGLLALGLGLAGFLSFSSPPSASGPHRYGPLDALWATTTLFDGGGVGGADLSHLNILLRIARVLAPVVIVYAGVRTVLVVLGDRVRDARGRGWRDHVVICGSERRERDLALSLCSSEHVAVVAEDASEFADLFSAGVRVIDGSPVDPRVLRSARADRARLVVAIGEDSAQNAEIAERAAEICASDPRYRTHVVANIDDPALAEIIRDSIAGSDGFTATPIDLDALAADALVATSKPEEDTAPHVLVLGDDRLAAEVVRAVARRWAIHRVDRLSQSLADLPPDGMLSPLQRLPVTLAGDDAVKQVQRLLLAHPTLDSVIDIEGVEGFLAATPTGAIWDKIQERGKVTRTYVTGVGVSDGVAIGLQLSAKLGDGEVSVAVPRSAATLEQRLAKHTRSSLTQADLTLVAVDRETLTLEVLESRDRIERLARAIHEERLRASALTRLRTGEDPDPPLVSWRQQQPAARDAARDRARILLRALSDHGWEIVDRDASAFGLGDLHDFSIPAEAWLGAEPSRIGFVLARSDLAASPESRALSRAAIARAIGDHDEQAALNLLLRSRQSGPLLEENLAEPLDDTDMTLVRELLELWDLARRSIDHPLADARDGSAIVIAGGARSMTSEQAAEAEALLDAALGLGRAGVVISGGTSEGIPGVVGRVASRHGWHVVGCLPGDAQASPDYRELMRTHGAVHSIREALSYWRQLIGRGVLPQHVRVLAFPGGSITRQEVLLASGLGAWVGLVSLTGSEWEEPEPAGRLTVKLPADAATIHAFIDPPPVYADPDLRERLAQAIHERYRRAHAMQRLADDPSMVAWSQLSDPLRESNRAQADAVFQRLAYLGLEVRGDRGSGIEVAFADELEALAELEHGRWNVERLLSGWRPGRRDPERRRTPYLVAYSQLPPHVADSDFDAVRAIPDALQAAGLIVVAIADRRADQSVT